MLTFPILFFTVSASELHTKRTFLLPHPMDLAVSCWCPGIPHYAGGLALWALRERWIVKWMDDIQRFDVGNCRLDNWACLTFPDVQI
jgi:hypothetical protein